MLLCLGSFVRLGWDCDLPALASSGDDEGMGTEARVECRAGQCTAGLLTVQLCIPRFVRALTSFPSRISMTLADFRITNSLYFQVTTLNVFLPF